MRPSLWDKDLFNQRRRRMISALWLKMSFFIYAHNRRLWNRERCGTDRIASFKEGACGAMPQTWRTVWAIFNKILTKMFSNYIRQSTHQTCSLIRKRDPSLSDSDCNAITLLMNSLHVEHGICVYELVGNINLETFSVQQSRWLWAGNEGQSLLT